MYQVIKPIRCSKCHSREIARPLNQEHNYFDLSETREVIDLVCLKCGHKKTHTESICKNGEPFIYNMEYSEYEEF